MGDFNYETTHVRDAMSKIMRLFEKDAIQPDQKSNSTVEKIPFSSIDETSNHNESTYSILEKELDTPVKQIKQTVSATQFQRTTLMRMQHHQNRRKDIINKLKEQINQQESQEATFKPQINKRSQQMIKSQPLFMRTKKIIDEKNAWRQAQAEIARKKREEEELQEVTFKPKLYQRSKPNSVVYENFEKEKDKWLKARLENLEKKKEMLQEKEKLNNTFKPQLSKGSLKLAQKFQNVPVQERLYEKQDNKSANSKQNVVQRKKKTLAQKSSEPIFNRLYPSILQQAQQATSVCQTPKNRLKRVSRRVKQHSLDAKQAQSIEVNLEQLEEDNAMAQQEESQEPIVSLIVNNEAQQELDNPIFSLLQNNELEKNFYSEPSSEATGLEFLNEILNIKNT